MQAQKPLQNLFRYLHVGCLSFLDRLLRSSARAEYLYSSSGARSGEQLRAGRGQPRPGPRHHPPGRQQQTLVVTTAFPCEDIALSHIYCHVNNLCHCWQQKMCFFNMCLFYPLPYKNSPIKPLHCIYAMQFLFR